MNPSLFFALTILLTLAGATAAAAAAHSVSYDSRAVLLDGKRQLLLSGSIHYQRVHPSDWSRALSLAVESGFNTIQTYTFWDEHEAVHGNISFSGQNDLSRFVSSAGSLGLHVVVRIGPYICGEHFNGGVPLWMRAIGGSGAACFRCSDPAWEAFTVHVLNAVVSELRNHNLFFTQGGPVIMLQAENEYGGSDQAYLDFVVAAARNATTDVPWFLCHDLALCTAVNAGKGPLGDALCTINGFWEDNSAEGVGQPSPAWIAGQVIGNPHQPLSWTEDQGWFDDWGMGRRVRHTSDILYGFARAVALGLSHHNFYMLTGGSNFGYSAAEGVTTAYAPDTAIDAYLLRHEPKFSTITAFQAALTSIADQLLSNDPSAPIPIGRHSQISIYGNVTFISNMGIFSNETEVVVVAGESYTMPNHTVVILNGGTMIFNTSAAPDAMTKMGTPSRAADDAPTTPPVWVTLAEHVGFGNSSAAPATGGVPLEMLNLTQNLVDYMWYSLAMPTGTNASSLKVSTCGGEYVYLFAGGSAVPADIPRKRQSHTFTLPPGGTSQIDILLSAMGLSTSPGPGSCKGLTRVKADGVDLTTRGWVSRWRFAGDVAQVYTPDGAAAAAWMPTSGDGGSSPISWFKTTFDRPASTASTNDGVVPQLAYALDLTGATKGVAWVNGFNIGRYNLELGQCSGPCAPPLHGGQCFIFWNNCGFPTQSLYYVPAALLLPKGNLVVLFEETAVVPVAGQTPTFPPDPPPALLLSRGVNEAPPPLPGTPRNLATVELVALTAHPE